MEIPPSSSVAQVSAYFTGYSNDEQIQQFLDMHPGTIPFKPTNSLDRKSAITSSGNTTDFKTEDFSYAWQMYTGQLMYPFDNIAQLEHHQFDPLYFDGSEERQAAFNVQENLIGLPLDSPQLVDPRVSYIDSLMKMREYHAGKLPLDSSYLNTLFMSTTEKGANYYLNQLNDLNEAMGKRTREGFAIKNAVDIPEDHYSKRFGQGVPTHEKPTVSSRYMENYSSTATVQSNFRRDRMNKATPEKLFIQKPPQGPSAKVITEQQKASNKPPFTNNVAESPTYIPYSSNVPETTVSEKDKSSQLILFDDNVEPPYTKKDHELTEEQLATRKQRQWRNRQTLYDVGSTIAEYTDPVLGGAIKFLKNFDPPPYGNSAAPVVGQYDQDYSYLKGIGKGFAEYGQFLKNFIPNKDETEIGLKIGYGGGWADPDILNDVAENNPSDYNKVLIGPDGHHPSKYNNRDKIILNTFKAVKNTVNPTYQSKASKTLIEKKEQSQGVAAAARKRKR